MRITNIFHATLSSQLVGYIRKQSGLLDCRVEQLVM